MGQLSPSASPCEAKGRRRSWIRRFSRPERARIRRHGCWASVRWAPGFLPAITQGLSSMRGSADGTSMRTRRHFVKLGVALRFT